MRLVITILTIERRVVVVPVVVVPVVELQIVVTGQIAVQVRQDKVLKVEILDPRGTPVVVVVPVRRGMGEMVMVVVVTV